MEKRNYQRDMEAVLGGLQGGETLLLHSCCAPCSSYCMEYLREYFEITVFYYNPNITQAAEYRKRVDEEKRLIAAYNEQVVQFQAARERDASLTVMEFEGGMTVTEHTHKIEVLEGRYDPESFLAMSKGLENCPEGGERCFQCYALRLREAARMTAKLQCDFFTTTLTISPLKNAEKLNEVGRAAADEFGVCFLPSDFKKKNGYKRSTELSETFSLYRQDYCGCAFSKAERLRQEAQKNAAEQHTGE